MLKTSFHEEKKVVNTNDVDDEDDDGGVVDDAIENVVVDVGNDDDDDVVDCRSSMFPTRVRDQNFDWRSVTADFAFLQQPKTGTF